ncbi:hypothetical protein Esti_002182 [Eimeria stiedai]
MGKARGRLSCFCWRITAGVVEPARKEPLKHPQKCPLGQCPNDTTDQAEPIAPDNQSGHGIAQQATRVGLMQSTADALEDASRNINVAAMNATEKPAEGAPRRIVELEQYDSAGTHDESGLTSTQMHTPADVTPGNESSKDDSQRTASQETTTASDTKDVGGDHRIASGETEPSRETSDVQPLVHAPPGASCTAAHPMEITNEGTATDHQGKSGDKQEDGSNHKSEENESGAKEAFENMRDSTPMEQTDCEHQPNPVVAEFECSSGDRSQQCPVFKELSQPEAETERPTQKATDGCEQPLDHALEEASPRAVTDDAPAPAQIGTHAAVKDIDSKNSESSQDEESSCGPKESGPDDVVSAVTTNSQIRSRRSKLSAPEFCLPCLGATYLLVAEGKLLNYYGKQAGALSVLLLFKRFCGGGLAL